MAYLTISTWKMAEGTLANDALATARDVYLPAVQSLGAISQKLIEISPTETVLITEWPDRETRDSASESVGKILDLVSSDGLVELIAEVKGRLLFET